MDKYYLYISISPVQSFISQARKTSDLFAGSRIISDLMSKAVEKFSLTDKLLLPAPGYKSFPNRFIAEIDISEHDADGLGSNIAAFVKSGFDKIAEDAVNGLPVSEEFLKKYKLQTDDALNVTWLIYRPESLPEADNYSQLERIFAAVKNQREFRQFSEAGRKCSVCGERNALVINESEKDKNSGRLIPIKQGRKNYDESAVNVFDKERFNTRVQTGEGLCAVCFTKRIYGLNFKDEAFMSTAHVATAKVLNGLKKDKEISDLLDEYERSQGFDHQLYYDDNLTAKYFFKHGLQSDESASTYKAKLKLKAGIKNKCEEKGLRFILPKYYAVILFDGDNMGKVLSGSFLKSNQDLKEFRHILSSQLGIFSVMAVDYVNRNNGKAVYAGGEDFLALINLRDALTLLNELRNLFDSVVYNEVKQFMQSDKILSFSAGICYAHYKTPLSFVLAKARETEKRAKKYPGKNAFALSVLKHSGEILECVLPFSHEESSGIPVVMDKIIEEMYNEKFSNTFIKNLHDEFLPLLIDGKNLLTWDTLFNEEMSRLVTKSCMIAKKEEKKAGIPELIRMLKILKNPSGMDIRNFLNALAIIDFIQRRTDGGE